MEWKELRNEKPVKEGWYVTKRTRFDGPSISMWMEVDGFGENSRASLWLPIPPTTNR